MSREYRGVSARRGIAVGTIRYYLRGSGVLPFTGSGTPEQEIARFRNAAGAAKDNFEALYAQARKVIGEEKAQVFRDYILMLEDPVLTAEIERLILEEALSAEFAVHRASMRHARSLMALPDAYIQARSVDVADVGRSIIEALSGISEPSMAERAHGEPYILAAETLMASDLFRIDRNHLVGIMTRLGSTDSHAAVIAKSMNIPVMIQVEGLSVVWEGLTGILDADRERLIVDPDREELAEAGRRIEEYESLRRSYSALVGTPNETADGRRIALRANIGGADELPAVRENDADGVGLLRSEMLYLRYEEEFREGADSPEGRPEGPAAGEELSPDFTSPEFEEYLYRAYRRVISSVTPHRAVIRTCDLGADKTLALLRMPEEKNPALGMRGVRISFARPGLFHRELRAILRASEAGPVGILIPMVTEAAELTRCRQMIAGVAEELKDEGTSVGKVTVGAMIETPAAAVMSDELAKESDFFSIGTNDLTQYTLAMDRQTAEFSSYFDKPRASVLRLIRMTVEAAHAKGIPVCICGELASDAALTETFVDMGVDELSVNPQDILPLRQTVQRIGSKK
ncbi:MAG: phosphoenolpyruvate--protein phosphotransferase [Lachnospiraceae bacterium]|nr:phosphoenolpyruvate--protein phosphotransferase [Lachnospiraceae bacterium]